MKPRSGIAVAAVGVLLVVSGQRVVLARQQSTTPTVTYTYDAEGRMASITNAAGLTSVYTYDAAGNVVAVSQPAAGTPSGETSAGVRARPPQLDSTRVSVPAGTTLLLRGSGFSVERRLDLVRIGSLIAPVLDASAASLSVRVPPGEGGPVEVDTPGGAAVAGDVTITGSPSPPPPPVLSAPVTLGAPQAPDGVTAVSGVVETSQGRPLAGVQVSIGGAWGGTGSSTSTDRRGRFLLAGAAAGGDELVVDATKVGGTDYGLYAEPLQVPSGRTTVLPWITYLTPIDTAHSVTVSSPTTKPTVVTSPEMPGLEVRIPAGTVIRDHYGRVVRTVSLTSLALDRTPFPLAPGMPMFFTFQPGDATFSGPGVQVVYPNVTHLPARSEVPYVGLNPSWGTSSWYDYGSGRVTADGAEIVPDKPDDLTTMIPFGYSAAPAPTPAPPLGGPTGGEPVDLATGLYTMNATDLSLPDSIPATLTRTYRDQDDVVRGFGIGMEDGFDWFVTPDPAVNTDYALVMPNGARIDYAPTGTPGVWDAVGAPSGFAGSVLTEGVEHVSTFVVTLKDGTVYDFGAEEALLDRVTNLYGSSMVITRDESSGQIRTVVTPGGKWFEFTYGTCLPGSNPTDCVTQVTDDAGRTVTYTYDGDARLIGESDASGHSTYTWAPCTTSLTCTELLTITDPNAKVVLQNTYDPTTGAVTAQTDADGGLWNYSYVASGGFSTQTTVIDPLGDRTDWTFGANHYPTSEVEAAGTAAAETTTFDYDPTTNLLDSSTDASGRTTSYTYDGLGDETSVTQLAGTPQASVTTYTYEAAFDRLASMTDPDGRTTTWTYEDKTRTVTEVDPMGNKTVTVLNTAAQPVSVADATGSTTYYSYLDGDVVAVADPAGDVTTAFYDGAGDALQITDPEGNTTQLTYNALGDVTSTTDPLGDVTRLGYDADGDLTSVTDPDGHTTTFTYTPMLEVASTTDPLGNSTSFTYDTLGELIGETTRNGVVDAYTYDALGRMTQASYGVSAGSAKTTITATYDAANRLVAATESGAGSYGFTYDGLDDVLTRTSPEGTVTSTYDRAGRRLTMSVPKQTTVHYTYNADGLVSTVVQGSSKVNVGYDADLRVHTLSLPGGIKRTNTYDDASRLSGVAYADGSSMIGTLDYTYTPDDEVAAESGSLAAVNLPAAVTASYNADNELTDENGVSYTYDDSGDLTSDGANKYTWNALDELTGVAGPGSASYTYDPFGRQATETTSGTTTSNLYDGSVLVEQTAGSSITKYLSSGQDAAYEETTAAGSSDLLTDGLGSVVGLANLSGQVTTSYTYSPSGVQTASGTAPPLSG